MDPRTERDREAEDAKRERRKQKLADEHFVRLMRDEAFRAVVKGLLVAAGQGRPKFSTNAANQNRSVGLWDFVEEHLLQRIKRLCPELEPVMDKEFSRDD